MPTRCGTWEGLRFVLFLKRYCLAESDEKIVYSANCEKQSLFTKLAEKWGYIGEQNLLVPLPERKKGLFLVRRKKKGCTGRKT